MMCVVNSHHKYICHPKMRENRVLVGSPSTTSLFTYSHPLLKYVPCLSVYFLCISIDSREFLFSFLC